MSEISVNTIICWYNDKKEVYKHERVLWIDSDKENLVLFTLWDRDIEAKNKKIEVEKLPFPYFCEMREITNAIKEGLAFLSIGDPYSKAGVREEDVSEKSWSIKEERWRDMEDLVICEPDIYDSKLRGALLRHKLESTGKVQKYFLSWLRCYWYGGKCPNALIPDYWNCGAPGKLKDATDKKRGRPKKESIYTPQVRDLKSSADQPGVNVDENMRAAIFSINATILDKLNPPSRRHAYNEMNRLYFGNGTFKTADGAKSPILLPKSQRPTFGQFNYWINLDNTKKGWENKIIAQKGKNDYLRNYRPLKGTSKQLVWGPGYMYQVDWTLADIYLVNRFNRTQVMKRAIVYVVIDVFSRMIVGLWVTYENASWRTASIVIENVASNKEEYCKSLGLESITQEDWPCSLLPQNLLADRGEFYTNNSSILTSNLGMKMSYASPYRADSKGIVEQMFRKLNIKAIHLLPGMVPKKPPKERKPSMLDAKYDIQQFTKILIKAAQYYNHNHWIEDYPYDKMQLESSINAVPINLWRNGIEMGRASFISRTPEEIKAALFPQKTATISRLGLAFNGLYYMPKTYLESNSKFGFKYGQEVTVIFDPRNVNIVWLKHIRQGRLELEECILIPRSERYKDCSFEDVMLSEVYLSMQKENHRDCQEQGASDLNAFIASIDQEANALNEKAKALQQTKKLNVKDREINTKVAIEADYQEKAINMLPESIKKIHPSLISNIDDDDEDDCDTNFTSDRDRKFALLKRGRLND